MLTGQAKEDLLKKYLKENFNIPELFKVGFFTKEMKNNPYLQAKRICDFFGFESVYEYGAFQYNCHITYGNPDDQTGIESIRPLSVNKKGTLISEPFVTVVESQY